MHVNEWVIPSDKDNISPSGPREYLESPKDVEEACLYESEEDTDEEWLLTCMSLARTVDEFSYYVCPSFLGTV
jgi:hypothetical protein